MVSCPKCDSKNHGIKFVKLTKIGHGNWEGHTTKSIKYKTYNFDEKCFPRDTRNNHAYCGPDVYKYCRRCNYIFDDRYISHEKVSSCKKCNGVIGEIESVNLDFKNSKITIRGSCLDDGGDIILEAKLDDGDLKRKVKQVLGMRYF